MTYVALQAQPKVDVELQEFYDGAVDLFAETRAGHLGRYCFSSAQHKDDKVRGDEHWTQFINTSKAYYLYHHGPLIISQAATHIGQLVGDAGTFIDLGTGSLSAFEHKVLPIIRAGSFGKITFVDLCTSFSEAAKAKLQQEGLHIKTDTFIGNFFKHLPNPSGKAVMSLFGGTLGNFIMDLPHETPEEGLARAMKHFAMPLAQHGGYFIFDYDTNEDAQSIHAGYDHPSYHAMEMTIFERMKRDLPTDGFNPDDFEHIAVWYPQWSLMAHEVRAKRDVSFKLGPYEFDIPAGKSFRTGNSFKYSDDIVERAANRAGFKRLQIFSLLGSTMRVALYRTD
jgi:L-histidine Nalpha-methyltransferase